MSASANWHKLVENYEQVRAGDGWARSNLLGI